MNKEISPQEQEDQADPSSDVLPLIEFLSSIYPLTDEIIDYLRQNTFRKKVTKGKFLLRQGEICNHYYYINKGVLRAFMKHGKKEITIWINPEGEVTTSIRSMRKQEPSQEYIQALTDCDLIGMTFEAMHNMYDLFPEMNRIGRMILEEYYADSEERVYIGRIPNASSRYQHFINSRPELLNRIPLKYIASYLGITMETLSRLRGQKMNKTTKSQKANIQDR